MYWHEHKVADTWLHQVNPHTFAPERKNDFCMKSTCSQCKHAARRWNQSKWQPLPPQAWNIRIYENPTGAVDGCGLAAPAGSSTPSRTLRRLGYVRRVKRHEVVSAVMSCANLRPSLVVAVCIMLFFEFFSPPAENFGRVPQLLAQTWGSYETEPGLTSSPLCIIQTVYTRACRILLVFAWTPEPKQTRL